MLVSQVSFPDICGLLMGKEALAVDTETTGLHPWGGDTLFSIIIGDDKEQFYFNFQTYPDFDPQFVLPREWIRELAKALADKRLFMHNAKFDLAFLFNAGCVLDPRLVHDTEVVARLLFNDHMKYSLDACAKRDLAEEKDDAVEKYIRKHKLWEWVDKDKKKKNKFFWKVPPKVIVPYGEKDCALTFRLGRHQVELLAVDARGEALLKLERDTTAVLFEMEKSGVRVDAAYSQTCLEREEQKFGAASTRYTEISGVPFKDANRTHEAAFTKVGAPYGRTEKGNPSFTDDMLEGLGHPLARSLQDYRHSYKMAQTYYRNFLGLSRNDGRLHPNIRQGGARTGRFSMSDPNLQNIPKKDEEQTEGPVVRRVFVPDPDHYLVAIDYDAMEFKLMLDYAGEHGLIEKIKAGLDPHQATADMTGLSRKAAKTLNFGLLYGMGIAKLAKSLNISELEAKAFKYQYFARLPLVHGFIKETQYVASTRGWVRNWCGRKYHFSNPDFAYRAANYIIQGGCSDIMRVAMRQVHEHLHGTQSKILLQIHDELLLQVHKDEMLLVPERVRDIMASAYTPRHIPMTCSIEWSAKSWGDLLDWSEFPREAHAHATGDALQDPHCLASTEGPPKFLVDENSASSALR